VAREPQAIQQSLELIGRGKVGKAAHVLEGPSCPDVFLSTDELVVVIEGKRTEPTPTTGTSWMRVRHQMLRHLDAASELRNGRALLGFLIHDENIMKTEAWQNYPDQVRSPEVLRNSLPHRTDAERREIADAFIGTTSWQAVCRRFGIPDQALISDIFVADA
jgi:hypothetical protein